jgi:hypothetical protein
MKNWVVLIAVGLMLSGCAGTMDRYKEDRAEAQSGVADKADGDSLSAFEFTAVKRTADTADALATENEGYFTTLHALIGPIFGDGDGTYTDMSAISAAELNLLDGVAAYDGIVAITGNATYELNTAQELEDAVSGGAYMSDILAATDAANARSILSLTIGTDVPDLSSENGYTGVHDFSGGTLAYYINVINDSDGITLTGEQLKGGFIVESGNQQTVAIGETAAAGKNFCVLADGADGSAEVYVDPYTGDHMEYDGTSAANGEYIYNSSDTKGDMMCFIAIDADTWIVKYDGNVTIAEETP